MNRIKYIGILVVVVASAIAVLTMERERKSWRLAPSSQSQATPPDHVIYRMLFHHLHVLSKKGEEAERANAHDSAKAYRRVFKNAARLSDQQAVTMNDIATKCEMAVKEVDARAKTIIEARRSHYVRTGLWKTSGDDRCGGRQLHSRRSVLDRAWRFI